MKIYELYWNPYKNSPTCYSKYYTAGNKKHCRVRAQSIKHAYFLCANRITAPDGFSCGITDDYYVDSPSIHYEGIDNNKPKQHIDLVDKCWE
jgi:hypothetical protein